MADAISIQELIDARTDAKTLEQAVNGDAVTTVLSRLGETYPTLSNALSQIDGKLDSADAQVKQGITNLFENGGLPATPFATKALMTASALVDGKYAMVTDDAVNNGLYIKTAGAWVKSAYDPAELAIEALSGAITLGEPTIPFGFFESSANLDTTAQVSKGFYIKNATGYIGASASAEMRRILVKDMDYIAFDRIISNSDYTVAFTNSESLSAGDVGAISAVMTVTADGVYTKVPAGYKYMIYNSVLGNINLINKPIRISELSLGISGLFGRGLVDNSFREEIASRQLIGERGLTFNYDKSLGNLFSSLVIINGFYVNSTEANKGTVSTYAESAIVEIPVQAGEKYTIHFPTLNPNNFVAGSSSLSVLKKETTSTTALVHTINSDGSITVTIPVGHKYLYFTVYLSSQGLDARTDTYVNKGSASLRLDPLRIEKINGVELEDSNLRQQLGDLSNLAGGSTLKDKRWVAVGDSITQKNNRATKNYHDFIREKVSDLSVTNLGIGGTGFYNRYDVASSIVGTPDLITVMLGTNDNLPKGITRGTFLDTGVTTINGCINTMIKSLLENFPTSKLAFITPIPASTSWGVIDSTSGDAFTIVTTADLVVKYCSHYSIPCLDLYRCSGLHPKMPVHNALYFSTDSDPDGDGMHPNALGQEIMATKIKPFLESLFL